MKHLKYIPHFNSILRSPKHVGSVQNGDPKEAPTNCKLIDLNCNAIRTLGIFNSYDSDLVEKINFLDNLKYLKKVLTLWEYSGLSLADKILVFKSLATSKLIYASTMKCPSKQILDQMNVVHKSFIWDNQKRKIKQSTPIADYSEGGYKDVDIETKISALKVTWVKRLLDSYFHSWKIIPAVLFSSIGGLKIVFHSNLKLSRQCKLMVNTFPKFYQELVHLWSNVSEKEPLTASEIFIEVVWNNSRIMSNKESLYNYHFISEGILTVRDLIDASGQLLGWTGAKQKYHLSSSQVLNWLGLIKCIPRTWCNLLISTPIDNCNIEEYPVNKELSAMTSKIACQNLLKPLLSALTAQRSLERVLKLTDIDWTKIYTLPRITTAESSPRTFQYNILNNILYLNERLFKFNMVESPLCSLCNQASESVSHLLYMYKTPQFVETTLCLAS